MIKIRISGIGGEKQNWKEGAKHQGQNSISWGSLKRDQFIFNNYIIVLYSSIYRLSYPTAIHIHSSLHAPWFPPKEHEKNQFIFISFTLSPYWSGFFLKTEIGFSWILFRYCSRLVLQLLSSIRHPREYSILAHILATESLPSTDLTWLWVEWSLWFWVWRTQGPAEAM